MKNRGVFNFPFLKMNHFVHACMEKEGRRVCTKMYGCIFTEGRFRNFDFVAYVNNEWPRTIFHIEVHIDNLPNFNKNRIRGCVACCLRDGNKFKPFCIK